MHICYLDESGVPEVGAGTSTYVLAGLAVPASQWKKYDEQITTVKGRHKLGGIEVHTAWMARYYPEQERIADFDKLSVAERRIRVTQERQVDLGKATIGGPRRTKSLAKNYSKSRAYIHLDHAQRVAAIRDLADLIGSWSQAVLFADIQEKSVSKPTKRYPNPTDAVSEISFEQVVSRFHHFLVRPQRKRWGMPIYDQNQALSRRLTRRMRKFHAGGTRFQSIERIVETPLFVDSSLTSMIQMADLCAYAIRRYIEKGEDDLFKRIYPRADRLGTTVVGLRHYTGKRSCECIVCEDHGR